MPVEFKDYYQTLGVSRPAAAAEIRKAFRKLARQYHPDVAKNKVVAEEKFKEINEAYEVLSDPEKRKKYDALGENWNRPGGFTPPPKWGSGGAPGGGDEFQFGGTGFSEFFEQFFGNRSRGPDEYSFFGRPRSGGKSAIFERHRPSAQRGRDIEGELLVTLDEVVQGCVRPVSVRHRDPATGEISTHSFRAKVPPGVQEGQRIRLAGKGESGVGEAGAGDLYLRVRFAKHPDFLVQGADLYHDLDLAPWEAALGAKISLPTLEGTVALKVPPGATTGQRLRVRGKGLPAGGGRGDLYAVVAVQVPAVLTPEEKSLWEELSQKSSFNPRK